MFEKRHYEWLAEFCAHEQRMAQGFQGSMLGHIEATTEHLISRLREDNPRFKPDRFRDKVAQLRDHGGRANYRGAFPVAAPREITCNWCGKAHTQPSQTALQALATCCRVP